MQKNTIETTYTQQLAHTHPHLPKAMLCMRDGAIAQFENFGLPHRRLEAWKYTDLRSVLKQILPPANLDVKPNAIIIENQFDGAAHIVIQDGVYVPKLSSARPEGVSILSIEQALSSDLKQQVVEAIAHPQLKNDSVVALNTGLKTSILVLHITAGDVVKMPVHVHNIFTQNVAYYTHLIVIAEENSKIDIIETQSIASTAQVNHIFQANIHAGAQLSHTIVQDSAKNSLNLRTTTAALTANSVYNLHNFVVHTPLCRHSIFVDVNGENAHPSLSGVQLVEGEEHQDVTIRLNHNAPHTTSLEQFKSVVRGTGVAVFQGKIYVAKPAQKTDAKMRANGMLLNEGAEFYVKPELEIYADDVLCAHGVTVGALDEDSLFYMQARGIPEAIARGLLVQSFVGEALELVENEDVRDYLSQKVEAWLS